MNVLALLQWLNRDILALPSTILFFGTAVLLTLKLRFLQIRAFPKFISLIIHGVRKKGMKGDTDSMSSFHALFTAMATTIGMGNVVGPSIAIMVGGPGALFWLLAYIFFSAAIKYAEVTFALETRIQTPDGFIIGGPVQYLKSVSSLLAYWYGAVIIFLFAGWSSIQSNTLASIFAQESVPHWIIGLTLTTFIIIILAGGAKRVGLVASKLVPFMFVLYVTFALIILFKEPIALKMGLYAVWDNICKPAAAMGAFAGSSVMMAMRAGAYQAIFISEAGLGTSSIPHATANTQRPTDQGILAMCSTLADFILSAISGLLVLVSGVWLTGEFRSTLVYEAFKLLAPAFGSIILLISITLFIVTTVIGNSFNGIQSFGALTRNRWMRWYTAFLVVVIFLGALMPVPLAWELMGTLLTLVAIPNLLGILILVFKRPEVLRIKK